MGLDQSRLGFSAKKNTNENASPSVRAVSYDEPLWQLAGDLDPSPSSLMGEAALRQEIHRSRSLLAAIVESSDDAIISCNLNGVITSWNKSAERIFGYSENEMLGHFTSELAPEDRKQDAERVLDEIRQGKTVDHYETIRRHKDGSLVVVSMTVSPIRSSTGELIGASKVSRDITSIRRAEEALRNADKLALAGRMAASIAHEINNPLEAITNLLYLLQHEDLPVEARNYLTLAQHELSRVSHIASETLGFFRNSRGSASISLADIADSALSLHMGRLATCNILVQKEYTSIPSMFLHQGELRQVFVNLVGNALDAMPKGGRLRIRIHPAFTSLSQIAGVRITIADTGMGMSRTTLRQIFEPFYTTKGSAGTGLGLWVTSQIIERHKGSISVRSSQSTTHSGTVFSIFLPRISEAPSSELEELSTSQQLSLPIEGESTLPEDASHHRLAEPDPPSTAYNAA